MSLCLTSDAVLYLAPRFSYSVAGQSWRASWAALRNGLLSISNLTRCSATRRPASESLG